MKNKVAIAFGAMLMALSFSGEANALGDALCTKVKNQGQRVKCQCATEYGGQARDEGNGKVRWTGPKGRGANNAMMDCQAKNGG